MWSKCMRWLLYISTWFKNLTGTTKTSPRMMVVRKLEIIGEHALDDYSCRMGLRITLFIRAEPITRYISEMASTTAKLKAMEALDTIWYRNGWHRSKTTLDDILTNSQGYVVLPVEVLKPFTKAMSDFVKAYESLDESDARYSYYRARITPFLEDVIKIAEALHQIAYN